MVLDGNINPAIWSTGNSQIPAYSRLGAPQATETVIGGIRANRLYEIEENASTNAPARRLEGADTKGPDASKSAVQSLFANARFGARVDPRRANGTRNKGGKT